MNPALIKTGEAEDGDAKKSEPEKTPHCVSAQSERPVERLGTPEQYKK
jgi:hypothetical protein